MLVPELGLYKNYQGFVAHSSWKGRGNIPRFWLLWIWRLLTLRIRSGPCLWAPSKERGVSRENWKGYSFFLMLICKLICICALVESILFEEHKCLQDLCLGSSQGTSWAVSFCKKSLYLCTYSFKCKLIDSNF